MPHTLRYGVTTNHVTGLEFVLPDGEIVRLGGRGFDSPGYDLIGLAVGSEGTLGIATRIVVRLVPLPPAVRTLLAIFATIKDASEAVAGIIGQGIVPAALEMMDNLCIRAVESRSKAGFPIDADAVLLIEVDGLEEEMDVQADAMAQVCRESWRAFGSTGPERA